MEKSEGECRSACTGRAKQRDVCLPRWGERIDEGSELLRAAIEYLRCGREVRCDCRVMSDLGKMGMGNSECVASVAG